MKALSYLLITLTSYLVGLGLEVALNKLGVSINPLLVGLVLATVVCIYIGLKTDEEFNYQSKK